MRARFGRQPATGDTQEQKRLRFKNLLAEYPELEVLKILSDLTVLINAPDFRGRSELARLSCLASLSEIRGLESLDSLRELKKLNRFFYR